MSEEEIRKMGEYLELKYVIARNVNKNDKLETQDKYIQKLYDAYLDLKIEYNQLQQENKELKENRDKAIEYIEETKYENCDRYSNRGKDIKNVISILKGDK